MSANFLKDFRPLLPLVLDFQYGRVGLKIWQFLEPLPPNSGHYLMQASLEIEPPSDQVEHKLFVPSIHPEERDGASSTSTSSSRTSPSLLIF